MPSQPKRPHIVLIMHAPLGAAFLRCAEHVLGALPTLPVVDVAPAEDSTAVIQRLVSQLSRPASLGQSYLFMTDLVGASPYQIAREAQQQLGSQGANIRLLTGTNLSMVLKAVADTYTPVEQFAEAVLKSGQTGQVIF